jgi:hypothetical protein
VQSEVGHYADDPTGALFGADSVGALDTSLSADLRRMGLMNSSLPDSPEARRAREEAESQQQDSSMRQRPSFRIDRTDVGSRDTDTAESPDGGSGIGMRLDGQLPGNDLRAPTGVGLGPGPARVRDVFSAMQMARTGGSTSSLIESTDPQAEAADAETANWDLRLSQARRMADQPLDTFVGTANSLLNAYLAEAETSLKAGEYREAASMYNMARAVDSDNPLPLLGRSMALLAAGDFLTSSDHLFKAIESFDQLGSFRVDLQSFVPDLYMLDRRRAQLERELKVKENYRLRFLLGFAEYSSGLEDIGLKDLKKALQQVPVEERTIHRYVQTLQRKSKGPGLVGEREAAD